MKKHTTQLPTAHKPSSKKQVDVNKQWNELFNDPLSGEVLEAMVEKAMADVERGDYLEKGFG